MKPSNPLQDELIALRVWLTSLLECAESESTYARLGPAILQCMIGRIDTALEKALADGKVQE